MSKNIEAFPVSTIDGFTQYGMTLRDYFAAKAMQGLLANPQCDLGNPYFVNNAANSAYVVADAMLEARGRDDEQNG